MVTRKKTEGRRQPSLYSFELDLERELEELELGRGFKFTSNTFFYDSYFLEYLHWLCPPDK